MTAPTGKATIVIFDDQFDEYVKKNKLLEKERNNRITSKDVPKKQLVGFCSATYHNNPLEVVYSTQNKIVRLAKQLFPLILLSIGITFDHDSSLDKTTIKHLSKIVNQALK